MTFLARLLIVVASVLPLACSSMSDGLATYGDSGAEREFSSFCSDWMEKLRERERANLAQLRLRPQGSSVSGQYTGYGQTPVECSARATGLKSSPFVGTLIYHEIIYSKSGVNRRAAKQSSPRTLRTIEVTELFRHDGTRWLH